MKCSCLVRVCVRALFVNVYIYYFYGIFLFISGNNKATRHTQYFSACTIFVCVSCDENVSDNSERQEGGGGVGGDADWGAS